MAWYRVQLTAAVQEVVIAERECHPQSHVRRKMLVLWLLPCGITRAKAATVVGLAQGGHILGRRRAPVSGLDHRPDAKADRLPPHP
jgi:hypothetical protein